MNLSDFNYDLPGRLIGQEAIEPRDSCKLMVLDKKSGIISHLIFRDLVNLLDDRFVLVLNDTKVFPARLFGHKESGGKIEVLLLKQLSPNTFTCILRGKIKDNQKLTFSNNLSATINQGVINFNLSGPGLLSILDDLGKTPLPPYIHSTESEEKLREQYQTIYARERGSAAAPTAGVHFTPELLENLKNKDVQIEYLTLHVGLGTFKPVTSQQIKSKILHTEEFFISQETAGRLNFAKAQGKKIIAVGTTTCRVLESQTDENGQLKSGRGETNIFIQPGYQFKFIDGLITNFHLPSTSLLMLVNSLTNVMPAYEEAIKHQYKFFSFGDAMLIL